MANEKFPIETPGGQTDIAGIKLPGGAYAEIVYTRPDLANAGTPTYASGTSGTPTLTGLRVTAINCLAGSGGASMTINGGSAITIPANTGYEHPIAGALVAPTIVFTGTASYVVCGVPA